MKLAWLALLPAAAPAFAAGPLRLPPGLVQTLPVSTRATAFGDAIRVVDCPDDASSVNGTCGNQLFGGLLMFESHFSGSITIRFDPPAGGMSHFHVSHRQMQGEDTVMSAPRLFGRYPVLRNQIADAAGEVSQGDVDLTTGEVSNLSYAIEVKNSAMDRLLAANPKLEHDATRFPGVYGDAWARFEQRPDGLLDFTFRGSTFLPLGKAIQGDAVRFPMPPCLSDALCSSVPAPGTSLHPHFYLSTRDPEGPECGANCPELPENTIREFTNFTHSTSFGDDFKLNIPELGGPAPGRSHLMGRVIVQFGPRTPHSAPVAIRSVLPTGLIGETPKTPLSVPGVLPGMVGFNEPLRFPLKTYQLTDVGFADDPFDIATGAVDLRTGQFTIPLLYRGYISQNLIFKLLEQNDGRIAPDSFRWRGPAQFEKGANGQTVFRFQGEVVLPFAGFGFPSPDFVKANGWVAGPGSSLDVFLRIQAMSGGAAVSTVFQGSADNVVSSAGERFSYSYRIACDGSGPATFTYTNSAAGGGTFALKRLASVQCTNSRTSAVAAGQADTVTFAGFGTWKDDGELHLATVQISRAPDAPYVGIQIDGGQTSNANTKPAEKPVP